MTYHEIIQRLSTIYDATEARAIARQLIEDVFNISHIEACLGALEKLDTLQKENLESYILRLEKGEPLQYILGSAPFMGRSFHVEPGVLIPRPETEVLVNTIIDSATTIKGDRNGNREILDIGCGSGCISISLALNIPSCNISAWDISDTALRITKQNAKSLSANISIYMQDALCPPSNDLHIWDIIVSNPPYICNKESKTMHTNVLDYEPHIALFVPDNDPLLFYRSIAEYGSHALRNGGYLFFEINEAYGKETVSLLTSLGYYNISIIKDQYNKDRVISAQI